MTNRPVRLLVHSIGSAGHVLPLVAWGLTAREEGHDVHFAVEAPLAPLVERHGLSVTALPTTDEMTDHRVRARLQAQRQALSGMEKIRSVMTMFVDRSRAGLETLTDVVAAFRPDVVLRDQAAYAGWVVAEAAGVPCVCFSFMPTPATSLAEIVGDALNELRGAAGLPPDPDLSSIIPALHLLGGPPGWYSDNEIGITGLLAQPAVNLGSTAADLPASVSNIASPSVYVSFGTVEGPSESRTRILFEGLRAHDVTVVATSPLPSGLLDDRLIVESWIPQLPLMGRVDAVIAHAGYGTIMTALTSGVPVLAIPSPMIDNQTNAKRLAATGAGRILQPEDVTSETVAREVHDLLNTSALRDGAQRTRLAIESLPTQTQAVEALEAVARGEPATHPVLFPEDGWN